MACRDAEARLADVPTRCPPPHSITAAGPVAYLLLAGAGAGADVVGAALVGPSACPVQGTVAASVRRVRPPSSLPGSASELPGSGPLGSDRAGGGGRGGGGGRSGAGSPSGSLVAVDGIALFGLLVALP